MKSVLSIGAVGYSGTRTGILRPYASAVSAMQQGLDIAVALLCLYLLSLYRHDGAYPQQYEILMIVIAPVMWVVYQWHGVYRHVPFSGVLNDAVALAKPWGAVLVILAVLGFATKTNTLFSRQVLLTWAVVGYAVQVLVHAAVRAALQNARAQGFNVRRAVLVGNGAITERFASVLKANPWLGIQVCGYLSADAWERRRGRAQVARERRRLYRDGTEPAALKLGKVNEIEEVIQALSIDIVYITLPAYCGNHIEDLVRRVLPLNVDVHWVPDMSTFHLINHNVREIEGQPILCLSDSPLGGMRHVAKWVEDKVLAILALVVCALPMLLIALGVKLSSPGPVLFRQRRHGLDGKTFMVLKFRTMKAHEEPQGTIVQARLNDPRVTRFGAFLRRTSLDELPQLFNVLRGEMSIVGPRPHAVEHNEYYRRQIEPYMLRHRIKPGITGWAQVNGLRGETEQPEKMARRVEYDLFYINNWSVWFDLRIVLMTVWAVLKRENAY